MALVASGFAAVPAHAALQAGVGKADITPRTGYYLGGWTRADRTSHGQHTRLFSRALGQGSAASYRLLSERVLCAGARTT